MTRTKWWNSFICDRYAA